MNHRIAYVNGRYLPAGQAAVSINDRGFTFADGVYEVMYRLNGVLLDGASHFRRLYDSLAMLSMDMPVSEPTLRLIIDELARRNHMQDGMVYLQITRGVATRNHVYPASMKPSLVITLSPLKTPPKRVYELGLKAITHPDERWKHCNAKTISLLPNALAKQKAAEAGCLEAILYSEREVVTEAGASNVLIVNADGSLQTHPKSAAILPGITRDVLLHLAAKDGIEVRESAFTLEALFAAQEVMVTSTTMGLMPIIQVDDHTVGNGKPGEVAERLLALYDVRVLDLTGKHFIE